MHGSLPLLVRTHPHELAHHVDGAAEPALLLVEHLLRQLDPLLAQARLQQLELRGEGDACAGRASCGELLGGEGKKGSAGEGEGAHGGVAELQAERLREIEDLQHSSHASLRREASEQGGEHLRRRRLGPRMHRLQPDLGLPGSGARGGEAACQPPLALLPAARWVGPPARVHLRAPAGRACTLGHRPERVRGAATPVRWLLPSSLLLSSLTAVAF
mmetsp:Transcript_26239/g.82182  ORF Transcript_26239/g.82182 Transcript_26239/m.82182 type:complete len:216 (+) Transcript_26239:239-886(+)